MLKKQKLLVGICTPAAALGAAAGATAIILGNKNTSSAPTKGDFRLSFVASEDARIVDNNGVDQNVYSGTTLDRIIQPQVQSFRPNHRFLGWKDENNNLVPGKFAIRKDTKLTAAFGDASTGDYVTITFKKKPTEPDVRLHGNVTVDTKLGWTFMMVNRPTAEWSDNYFQCWQISDGKGGYTDFAETTQLTGDVVLYPKFTQAATITWDAGDGGHILRGQNKTTLASGTIFNKYNQPQLYNDDLNKEFAGWYKDTAYAHKWSESEQVTGDAKAIAKWTDAPKTSTKFHTISFVKNDAQSTFPTPIFSPSTSTVVQVKDDEGQALAPTWGETTKPQVTTADGNYELVSWQWRDTTETEADQWKDLDDAHTFTEGGKTTEVRPVMKCSISDVTISGSDSVLPESTNTYYASVGGTKENPYVSQTVNWGVYNDAECKSPYMDGDITIDENGNLSVQSLTTDKTIYIKAASKTDKTKWASKEVQVLMPYHNSQNIWYHDGSRWWSISQKDGLCATGDILAKPLSAGETKTWSRQSEFTYKLYIGDQLTSLYDQFGYKWTGFNGQIDFANSNIHTINDSFLEGCTSFNQKLDLSKVRSIGSNFLYNCTSFGNEIDPETGLETHEAMITFTDEDGNSSLESIGSNFLGGCSSYNRILELPTANDIEIGDAFLYNCVSFNQNITIPNNVVAIEDFFMMNCNSFTSKITVNCPVERFIENIHNISSTSSGADIYTLGYTVAGTYAEEFADTYPTSVTNNSYRRVNSGESTGVQVTGTEYTTAVGKLMAAQADANFTVDASGINSHIILVSGTTTMVQESESTTKFYYETELPGLTGKGVYGSFDASGMGVEENGISIGRSRELYQVYEVALSTNFEGGKALAYGDWKWNATTKKYETGNFQYKTGKSYVGCKASMEFYPETKEIAMITIEVPDVGKTTLSFYDWGKTKFAVPKSFTNNDHFCPIHNGSTPTATNIAYSDSLQYPGGYAHNIAIVDCAQFAEGTTAGKVASSTIKLTIKNDDVEGALDIDLVDNDEGAIIFNSNLEVVGSCTLDTTTKEYHCVDSDGNEYIPNTTDIIVIHSNSTNLDGRMSSSSPVQNLANMSTVKCEFVTGE